MDNEKGREAWLKAFRHDQLTWTQVSDLKGWENVVATLYAVRAIPQNFLVDPAGNIIDKDLRGDELTRSWRSCWISSINKLVSILPQGSASVR